jgi:hypothetical protein
MNNLNSKTIKELIDLCKSKSISGYSGKKKSEIIDLINNNTAESKINETSESINNININDYLIPNKTFYRVKYNNSIVYSTLLWSQVEGVPCKVISIVNDGLILNSFSSSDNKTLFKIDKEDLVYFKKATVVNGYIIDLPKYPSNKLSIKEFDIRTDIVTLVKNVKKIIIKHEKINKIISDKLEQIRASQGCMDTVTINDFKGYISNKSELDNKIKRIGDPIFNRSNRWCPPIKMSYDEFKNSNSFPAPLGVRTKDFALPSTVLRCLIEMIKQVCLFQNINAPPELKELLKIENNIYYHRCKWCNNVINADEYSSEYSSQHNFIEICHRNPNGVFEPDNIYWGHGSCNREQGGYSETERISQALRLLSINPESLKEHIDDIQKIINTIKK